MNFPFLFFFSPSLYVQLANSLFARSHLEVSRRGLNSLLLRMKNECAEDKSSVRRLIFAPSASMITQPCCADTEKLVSILYLILVQMSSHTVKFVTVTAIFGLSSYHPFVNLHHWDSWSFTWMCCCWCVCYLSLCELFIQLRVTPLSAEPLSYLDGFFASPALLQRE